MNLLIGLLPAAAAMWSSSREGPSRSCLERHRDTVCIHPRQPRQAVQVREDGAVIECLLYFLSTYRSNDELGHSGHEIPTMPFPAVDR